MATSAIIGRIIFAPFFMASREPTKLPAIEHIRQGTATTKRIFLAIRYITVEPTFEAKFISLVVPLAFTSSKCSNEERINVKNIPVPGPKNPS